MRTFLSFIAISITSVALSQTPTPKKEKTYTVNFDKTEWSKVFEWFEKESGLTYLGTNTLKGTLTLKPDKPLTLCEVWGLLNSKLEPLGYAISLRHQSIILHKADEKLPRDLIPLIHLDELKDRCDQEIVIVIIPLTFLAVEDGNPIAKKLLSVIGEVAPFGSNQIIVYDKVKNIRSILKYIDDEYKRGRDQSDQFTHVCRYVSAKVVAEKLRLLLDIKDEVKQEQTSPYGGFTGFGRFDEKSGIDPRSGGADTRGKSEPRPTERFQRIQVAVDESANTIFVTGPADRMELVKSIVASIDTPPVTCQPVCQTRPRPILRLFRCR